MLEPPSAWNIIKVVGISTGSEPRSQEVVARSGFGLYGLGWLRRFRRLNSPGNPISNSRFPRSDGFQKPLTKEASQSKLHRFKNTGTSGRVGFRLIRTWVAPAPL